LILSLKEHVFFSMLQNIETTEQKRGGTDRPDGSGGRLH